MDTRSLTDALRNLNPDDFTWKFALYSTHKGRDGIELEWNLAKMRGISTYIGRLTEHLLKKPVADKPVAPYTPFLSDKENIGAMAQTEELIQEQISEILLSIEKGQAYAPEDYVSGVMPKSVGYACCGERRDEDGNIAERILFMRRGNPFLTSPTARLCATEGDEIVTCDRPLLKFTMAVDFLLLGGVCYLFSSAIEKDLAMENRHVAIAQKRMESVAQAQIISQFDRLEEAALKAKNARKFVDFDRNILDHITRLPVNEREEFLSTYGVTIDPAGRMDTSDPAQCELIIDLLCCRSCLDPLGRLSVGSNITPRE